MSNQQDNRLMLVHTDHRRRIEEFNGEDFSIQYLKVYERLPLGNHYHTDKVERFVITDGPRSSRTNHCGQVRMYKVDEYGNRTSDITTRELHIGDVIEVRPFVAHVFVLIQGTHMICFSSARYDPDNPDMHLVEPF